MSTQIVQSYHQIFRITGCYFSGRLPTRAVSLLQNKTITNYADLLFAVFPPQTCLIKIVKLLYNFCNDRYSTVEIVLLSPGCFAHISSVNWDI